MFKICMVGTGYVGLVSGACLADFGNRVICVDINEERIASIRSGIMPIYEPGLKDLVERNYAAGSFSRPISPAPCGIRSSFFRRWGLPSARTVPAICRRYSRSPPISHPT